MVERRWQPAGCRMDGSHFHAEYELYYLVHGRRRYFIQDRSVPVEAGSLVFINCRVLHRTLPEGDAPHERILLNFEAALLRRWQSAMPDLDFAPLLRRNYFVLPAPTQQAQAGRVETILETVLEAAANEDGTMAALKTMELLLLLTRAAQEAGHGKRPPAPTQKQRRTEQMLAYIAQQGYRVTLDELSERFYISRYYLCRMFKEESGMTLHEYLHSSRVLCAQALLETTVQSVTEVAQQAGFDTLTQFERIFKAYVGVSPRVYRRNKLAVQESNESIL